MSTEDANCNQDCDPMAADTRRLGAVHFADCPVWAYLKHDHAMDGSA